VLPLAIRPAVGADQAAILFLADRLAAFGPTTRSPAEVAERERRALAVALARPSIGSAVLVAENQELGLAGVLLLESRRDYFTDEQHGHVAILAVAREAEGRGVGRALLAAAEEWGRAEGFRRLTLSVFTDNLRARDLYARQGWRPELETWYKTLV
jgi:GNAT superfamily N-acetyltransferase